MELLSVPLELTCSGVGVAGPSDCPQTIAISPGETPVASYEAALVTAETTGCGTLMALCASGITNSVIEYAGNVAVRLLPATLMSEVWRTMAARFVWLYCHTCAVPAAAKLARLMVSLISPVVLFSTSSREVGEADGVANIASGLVQHQHGQSRVHALRGEDRERIRIAAGARYAGAAELAAVAVVIQEDLERECAGIGGCRRAPERSQPESISAEDAQDIGLRNGTGDAVKRAPTVFGDRQVRAGIILGHPLLHLRNQMRRDFGAGGVVKTAAGHHIVRVPERARGGHAQRFHGAVALRGAQATRRDVSVHVEVVQQPVTVRLLELAHLLEVIRNPRDAAVRFLVGGIVPVLKWRRAPAAIHIHPGKEHPRPAPGHRSGN